MRHELSQLKTKESYQVSPQKTSQPSPTKKFQITMNTIPKRTIKLEECCENQTVVKKTINQNDDLKKKHIDKITKIIERSNAFVNELMTRRQN